MFIVLIIIIIQNVEENLYKLKVIEKRSEYEGAIQQKNIITQNINGPCPLLALCKKRLIL